MRTHTSLILVIFASGLLLSLGACRDVVRSTEITRSAPSAELLALWEVYKSSNVQNGRVISWDEHGITTSEGQSYALLRAVECNDAATFEQVWRWTHEHLQVRYGDNLFSWKWKDQIIGADAATDADSDMALALILAASRFNRPDYLQAALSILDSIWKHEIASAGDNYYVTAGNWAVGKDSATLHVGYFAPYAYQIFATVDKIHPWPALIQSSYNVLHWIYFDQHFKLPPEVVCLDRQTQELSLATADTGQTSTFSYDVFPIFWRVALDSLLNDRHEGRLRRRMMKFFQNEWKDKGLFFDHYQLDGRPLSAQEGMPLYATLHSLALVQDPVFAASIEREKLNGLRANARAGQNTPYYLQNWLWFDEALEEKSDIFSNN